MYILREYTRYYCEVKCIEYVVCEDVVESRWSVKYL